MWTDAQCSLWTKVAFVILCLWSEAMGKKKKRVVRNELYWRVLTVKSHKEKALMSTAYQNEILLIFTWYLFSTPTPYIFFLSPSFPICNCVEVFTKGSLLSQKALNINTTIILYIIHYKLNVLVGLHNKIWWGGCLFKGDNRKKFDGEILLSEVVESER